VVQFLLRIIKVLQSRNHITFEGWVEVVINVLGWILPLLLRGFSSNLESVVNHTFGRLKRGKVINDFVVSSKVWHSVVDFVTKFLLLVLILSATGGRADWVRLHVRVNLKERWHLVRWPVVLSLEVAVLIGINTRENPSAIAISCNVPGTSGCLGFSNVVLSEFDVLIFTEVWNKVVSWGIIRTWGSVIFMAELFLGHSNVGLGVLNLSVLTEMWHEIVSWWISSWS